MKTTVIHSVAEFRRLRRDWGDDTLGFVPTMGALHDGHAALVRRARHECQRVAVSIYVNPTQFSDANDLTAYPRTIQDDLRLLRDLGVDAVFVPDFNEIYPDGYRYKVTEDRFSRELCGAHRPGHFDGVLTVVMKLLNIVGPHRAYFGEKDYQQYLLVRDMVQAFFLPVEIVACPTVREYDGLAMSSRNRRLDEAAREIAGRLNKILREFSTADAAATELRKTGFDIDYVSDLQGRRLAAARLGGVRLIDNVELKP